MIEGLDCKRPSESEETMKENRTFRPVTTDATAMVIGPLGEILILEALPLREHRAGPFAARPMLSRPPMAACPVMRQPVPATTSLWRILPSGNARLSVSVCRDLRVTRAKHDRDGYAASAALLAEISTGMGAALTS